MADLNFNGIDDYVEATNDWNYNGIDDYVEATNDWDYNGIDDYIDATNDWNYNGIDDYVEATNDWDYNGIDDYIDATNDWNYNGIDDYVEATNDWDYNGIDDYIDATNDWNYNGIDDYVEATNDWDYNGIDDYIDATNDWNYNGIDDALEVPAVHTVAEVPVVEAVPTLEAPGVDVFETILAPVAEPVFVSEPTFTDVAPAAPMDLSWLNDFIEPAPAVAAPIWETAPADDLDAAFAFADQLVADPFAHPALESFQDFGPALDRIAGPAAIADVIGLPSSSSTTLDDLVWQTTFGAADRAFQDHLNGTGLVGQFSFPSLSTQPGLQGLDTWLADLEASARASGAWRPGAGGFDGLILNEINQTQLATEIRVRDQILGADDALFAALDTTGLGFTLPSWI
ncbi:MAG: hypothetical protein R8F63_01160 [Acidimicrobiales bacterium]|nr:hypothetical protein [Acidimicrobiales bacterium]